MIITQIIIIIIIIIYISYRIIPHMFGLLDGHGRPEAVVDGGAHGGGAARARRTYGIACHMISH